MRRPIFNISNGDFIYPLSDNFGFDSNGDYHMRMGDHMSMDLDSGEIHYNSGWENDDHPFGRHGGFGNRYMDDDDLF